MSGDLKTQTTGQVGYDAYRKATGGLTFDGRPMPTWNELPEPIQHAWTVASAAMLASLARVQIDTLKPLAEWAELL